MLFQKGARSGKVEPLHALNGVMQGSTISGQFTQRGRPTDFSFVISKAEYKDGQLHLRGNLTAGRASEEAVALFGGSVVRPYNPWPGPSEELPKEEEKKEGAKLERNEQTQSLYTPSTQIAGCEVFYLSLTPSAKMRALLGTSEKVQLGVVLSTFDNRKGEAISRQMWQVLMLKPGSSEIASNVEKLNGLLGS